jgi:hypothetical protein
VLGKNREREGKKKKKNGTLIDGDGERHRETD